jgi:hypothetical protein
LWALDSGGFIKLDIGGQNLFVFEKFGDCGCYNDRDLLDIVTVDSDNPRTGTGNVIDEIERRDIPSSHD